MNGISGYVSIMMDDSSYLKLDKKKQLEHDLYCLNMAGMSGPTTILNTITQYPRIIFSGVPDDRKQKITDVKRMILNEERKMKIKKIGI